MTHQERSVEHDLAASPSTAVPFDESRDERWPTVDLGDVQRRALPAVDPAIYGIESELDPPADDVHAAAAAGTATPTTNLPHAEQIQRSFGGHDLSNIRAHVDPSSAHAMGAAAYAAGDHVVFDREPDLHTAAHEAAHVVQQAHGVNLYGGVGEAGDSYERAADAVADRVVAGQSAVDLLGAPTEARGATGAIQRDALSRQQLTMNADGNRGTAISSKLRIAALHIHEACDTIQGAVRGGDNEMGAEGVLHSIVLPAFTSANSAARTVQPFVDDMTNMGFQDRNTRDGAGIYNEATHRFAIVEMMAKQWARNHNLRFDGITVQDAKGIRNAVSSQLGVPRDGPDALSGTEEPGATETGIMVEGFRAALDAAESSSSALVLALREADPRTSAPALMQGLAADLRLCMTSIPQNARTTEPTYQQMSRIARKVEQAWTEGRPYGYQVNTSMIFAFNLAPALLAILAERRSAKPAK